MSIQTTKLSEVEAVQSAIDPKLLIEDEGEIKRISPEAIAPSQVQVDWEETDASSPAYILNKPESLGGSGGEIVYYYPASGGLIEEATALMASKATVVNQWNTGARIRIRNATNGTTFGDVMGVSYTKKACDVICTFMHLREAPLVKAGDKVNTKTLLGYYGGTGAYVNGDHLHIQFDTDTKYPLACMPMSATGHRILKRGTIDSTVEPCYILHRGKEQTVALGKYEKQYDSTKILGIPAAI